MPDQVSNLEPPESESGDLPIDLSGNIIMRVERFELSLATPSR